MLWCIMMTIVKHRTLSIRQLHLVLIRNISDGLFRYQIDHCDQSNENNNKKEGKFGLLTINNKVILQMTNTTS
jgi:hypothetical protein